MAGSQADHTASYSSGGSSSGGSASYAATAGHADTADEAGHADIADEATHAVSATDVDSDSPAYDRWLRKDQADTAAEHITFTGGMTSGAASTFNEVVTFVKKITATVSAWFKQGFTVGSSEQYGMNASGALTTGTITAGGNVGVTGNVSATGNMSASGNLNAGGDAIIGGNETVTGSVTAASLIASLLKTPDFAQAVGMIGLGFGVTTDQNGKATLQTDDLLVLGRMIVNSLNIREVTYIGGTYLLTPAGSTVAKVMPLYVATTTNIMDTRTWDTTAALYNVGYRLLWKADDGTTGTMNYWNVGDQAYCQTFNITEPGDYANASNRRYWRLVCRVGQVTLTDSDGNDTVWHYADISNVSSVYLYDSNGNRLTNVRTGTVYFTGCENVNGSVPQEGDKVVCLGSQYDTTRQGAVQITAEGTASIGIYDGINQYLALTNYEIHYFSKEAVRMNASYVTWKTTSGNQTQQAVIEQGTTNATAISNTNTRLDTAEQSLQTIQTTVGGHTTQISTLTQTAEGLTSQVTALKSGKNLLSGELTGTGWLSVDSSDNENDASINSAGGIYHTDTYLKSPSFSVVNGEFYTLSFWAKNIPVSSRKVTVWAIDPGDEQNITLTRSSTSTDDGLYLYKCTFTAIDSCASISFAFATASIPVYKAQVELGTTATEFEASSSETTSRINQKADSIELSVINKLGETGININGSNREINLIAGKVNFLNAAGTAASGKISIDPTTGTLSAVDGNFSGILNAKTLYTRIERLNLNPLRETSNPYIYWDSIDWDNISSSYKDGILPNILVLYSNNSNAYSGPSSDREIGFVLPQASEWTGFSFDVYVMKTYSYTSGSTTYHSDIIKLWANNLSNTAFGDVLGQSNGGANIYESYVMVTSSGNTYDAHFKDRNTAVYGYKTVWHVKLLSDGSQWIVIEQDDASVFSV